MAKKLYTHQQIRKTLKQDDLRVGLDRLWHYARTNTENLIIAGIIVGGIAVLVPLYLRHQATNEMRATSLLDRAWSYISQRVDLNAAMVGQGFKSYEEKYQKVQQAFAEIGSTYRGTRAAKLAADGEAVAWFSLREYDKALAAFQALLAQHPKDFWTAGLLARIGACQEGLAKWQEALATYQTLAQDWPDYFDLRSVRLGTARCLAHLGKLEEARKLLAAEAAADPGSDVSQEAGRLLALYAGGVK
jgi:tetratricopeptide (TPR) repeat protein